MIKKVYSALSYTKIAIFGFLLVLIPCIIFSYVAYQSINKRAGTVRANYKFTIDILRDRVVREILNKEEKLSTNLNNLVGKTASINYLKSWLASAESENPVIMKSFFLNTVGGVVTASYSVGWQKDEIRLPKVSKYVLKNFKLAQTAEFSERNLTKAIKLYSGELVNAVSGDSVILMSCIARCYFKTGRFNNALNMYKRLSKFKNDEAVIGAVPARIAALNQTAAVFEKLKDYKNYLGTCIKLYTELLSNPWNHSEEDYNYYIKSASDAVKNYCRNHDISDSVKNIINGLENRESEIYKQENYAEFIKKNIYPEIKFSDNQKSNGQKLRFLSFGNKNSVYRINYYIIPDSSYTAVRLIFGFQTNEKYIIKNLLPESFAKINLGSSLTAGLLNRRDSILYCAEKLKSNKYLLSENLSSIFPDWKIALFDREGKSIEEEIAGEKQQSFLLFGLTLFVMLTGIAVIITAARHEYQISKMKSDFVSNVSHELKTPLSIVRMFGETLESGIVTDKKKQKEFYGIIKRESERLTNLINNVLDFSKIEKHKKDFHFKETNIIEVVKSVLESYSPEILQSGFTLDVNIRCDEILVQIDRDAIAQAIINLISNALKYSGDRKYISVVVFKQDSSAVISVADRGLGIPAKEIKHIFDNFYRIKTSQTNDIKGTGLGLTIVKYIVEAHKGSITAESKTGEGSKFTIMLPA